MGAGFFFQGDGSCATSGDPVADEKGNIIFIQGNEKAERDKKGEDEATI